MSKHQSTSGTGYPQHLHIQFLQFHSWLQINFILSSHAASRSFSKLLELCKRLQLISLLFSPANLGTFCLSSLLSFKPFLISHYFSGLSILQSVKTSLSTFLIAFATALSLKILLGTLHNHRNKVSKLESKSEAYNQLIPSL